MSDQTPGDLPPTHEPYGSAPQQPGQQPGWGPYGADPYAQQPPFPHPAPGGLSDQDRTWASAAHWGTFIAAWLAMGILAPLLVLLVQGPKSPFVRKHAVESLNFQISLLIYGAVALVAAIATLGLGLIVIVPVGAIVVIGVIVVIVMASIAAANGEDYRYPLTIRLVR